MTNISSVTFSGKDCKLNAACVNWISRKIFICASIYSFIANSELAVIFESSEQTIVSVCGELF